MPDRENVIEGLEMSYKYSNVDEDNTLVPQWIVLHVIALLKEDERAIKHQSDHLDALLKAQEAVKPVVDIDTWKCGNCRHTLEHQELLGDNVLFHEQYNYCPECGRAVKWE